MTKKEIRKIITENFDECLLRESASFIVSARGDMVMTFEREIGCSSTINLDFDGGVLRLFTDDKNHSRNDMINFFTNFVWTTWFNYKD